MKVEKIEIGSSFIRFYVLETDVRGYTVSSSSLKGVRISNTTVVLDLPSQISISAVDVTKAEEIYDALESVIVDGNAVSTKVINT